MQLNERYFDVGYPEPRGNWPQSRNYTEYRKLLTRALPNSAEKSIPATINIPSGSVVFDAGMGDGNALADLKRERDDITTIGCTLNEYNHDNADQLNTICFSPIPNGRHARILFQELRNTVQQVFCVFGPCTYSDNPILAMIYLGLLLKEGGRADIISTSILGDDLDKSPIGYCLTRQKTKTFFCEQLQLDMNIVRTKIESAVSDGFCYDFLIAIKPASTWRPNLTSLDTIFARAITELSEPIKIRKQTTWGDFDCNQSIQGRRYCHLLTSWCLDITAIDMSSESITNEIFCDINFRNRQSQQQFCYAFNEFFGPAESGWQFACDVHEVHLRYCDSIAEPQQAKSKKSTMKSAHTPWQKTLRDLAILELPKFTRVAAESPADKRVCVYRALDHQNFFFSCSSKAEPLRSESRNSDSKSTTLWLQNDSL